MMSALSDAAVESRTYAKVDRHLIPFLFLCYVLAYLDRVNIGFAKLQMQGDLALSDAAFATGAGIFFIGYFFFAVPSNVLLERFGARIWIALSLMAWGSVSSMTMLVRTEWEFYCVRFLLGLAESGFFPGIILYLTFWYPSRLRSTRTAFFVSAIAVSGVLGNPISGLVMDRLSGADGLHGWQWLFLVEGVPSILVGLCVYLFVPSGIEEPRWLTVEEKTLLRSNISGEDRGKREVRFADAFKSGTVYALCAIYFTLMVGLYGIAFALPTLVSAFGVKGYFDVGLITAIPYIVAVVGMLVLSWHSDRTGERRLHYVLNVTAGAFGLVLSGVTAGHPVLSTIGLSIATLGVIGSIPIFWPIPSAFLAGTAAAAGIGAVNSLGNLGGYIGPNVPVWVKPFWADPSAALYVIAGILLAGGVIAFVVIPKDLTIRTGGQQPVGPGEYHLTPKPTAEGTCPGSAGRR
jgi:MFS family permease